MISSSIQTLLSVLEFHQVSINARGLYHRSGIAPCPEDYYRTTIPQYIQKVNKNEQNIKLPNDVIFCKRCKV